MSNNSLRAGGLSDRARHPQRLPHRQVLTDSVYETVKEQIMDLDLVPGSRINMDQLARDLQVSTTPLREALTRLEAEGLVIRQNLRGYIVASQPSRADLRELFILRLLLEPEAARAAAGEPDAEVVFSLRGTLDRMAEVAMAAPDEQYRRHRALVEADAVFHDTIAAASGNRLLRRTLAGLHSHVLLYRLYFEAGMAPERRETAEEHMAVLDAIVACDPERAAAAMRVHTERSRERVLRSASAVRPS